MPGQTTGWGLGPISVPSNQRHETTTHQPHCRQDTAASHPQTNTHRLITLSFSSVCCLCLVCVVLFLCCAWLLFVPCVSSPVQSTLPLASTTLLAMSIFNAPPRPVVRAPAPTPAAPSEAAPTPAAAAAAAAAATPAEPASEKDPDLKIILLGDSAVGKSKLVERFLMNDYVPRQMSTYALTVFRHKQKQEDGKEIEIDFWVRTHTHTHTTRNDTFRSMNIRWHHQISHSM